MTKLHIRRLEKLAKHLESGKLGHERFDFSEIHLPFERPRKSHCGSAGCALGECPVVFPGVWKFRGVTAGLRIRDHLGAFDSAGAFFSLTQPEVSHLFSPHGQQPKLFGGEHLNSQATRQQVAAGIRAFLKIKAKQQTKGTK